MNLKNKLLDKLDILVDKFEQYYYTKIARPSEYYDEEVLSEITNGLLSNELISMGCFDDISITGYNDYLIIHLNNYDWKISYEQAEVLMHDLDYVLEWRKE